MKLVVKVFIQMIVIAAIVLLFSGHFHLQARHEQLRNDFDGHWHYSPRPIIVAIDEPHISDNVPYHLTKPKQQQQQSYYWNYVYQYCWR